MPKIVDPEARRQAVAAAVLRVVSRDGLEKASLRNVADEAGLAIGSVRHYVTDQAELMMLALRELGRRVDRRVYAHAEQLLDPDADIDRRARTEDLLAELLPLDETRHEEAVLWLAFTTAARTRPELRARADALHEGMHALVVRVLREWQRVGGLPEALDVETEALRLSALLDGLALQVVLQPAHVTPDDARRVLRRHLGALKAGS
ncbi:TetR/AcrR family transcriptional regulator [Streptomyces sp. QH1-20]|uniref:TetR/AcrR family transcriptional regulator n=1 Tax=Streptomyces sp. QH1-20 TaxID=3240934 RepID=UPI00351899B2